MAVTSSATASIETARMESSKNSSILVDDITKAHLIFTTHEGAELLVPIDQVGFAVTVDDESTSVDDSDNDDDSSVTSDTSTATADTSASSVLSDTESAELLAPYVPVRDVQLAQSLLSLDKPIPMYLEISTRVLMERVASGEHFYDRNVLPYLNDSGSPVTAPTQPPNSRGNGTSDFQKRQSDNGNEFSGTASSRPINGVLEWITPEPKRTWTEESDLTLAQNLFCLDEEITHVCSDFSQHLIESAVSNMAMSAVPEPLFRPRLKKLPISIAGRFRRLNL